MDDRPVGLQVVLLPVISCFLTPGGFNSGSALSRSPGLAPRIASTCSELSPIFRLQSIPNEASPNRHLGGNARPRTRRRDEPDLILSSPRHGPSPHTWARDSTRVEPGFFCCPEER